MGYLCGTRAIKGSTIVLTVSEDENANGNIKPSKDDLHFELKHSSSSNYDYLKIDFASLNTSSYVARRRMFEVNGDPLNHWEKNNFEPKQDNMCRVVYEPKIGRQFFQKTLPVEDYAITRGLIMSLEQPYFSKYNRFFPRKGHFCCKVCGNPLYSSEAKFDVDDGWPAFGACVLGSIGVTPIEDRIAQIEKKERACMKIQAFVRGYLCRLRVEGMLNEMIEVLMRRKLGYSFSVGDEQTDWTSEGNLSSEFSWSSSSDESDFSKESGGSDGGYILSRALGEDHAEIHCHRCKSHLGDVFVQKNIRSNREMCLERHRVNGRGLKYMDEDLPEGTMANSSLLFANASERRRFGLPDTKENEGVLPFGTLHWLRKSSDPLSVSNHENFFLSDIRRPPLDPLGVSYHASPLQMSINCKPSPPKMTKNSLATSKKSTKRRTSGRCRPMRRGSTESSISITDQIPYLEKNLTHFIPK